MAHPSVHPLAFPVTPSEPRPDREASGLLDLRALARSLRPAPGPAASAPTAFTPPLGVTSVLAPRRDVVWPAWLVPVLIVGGVLVLTALTLAIVLVTRPGPGAPPSPSRAAPAAPRPVVPAPAVIPEAPRSPETPAVVPAPEPVKASPAAPEPRRRRPATAVVRRSAAPAATPATPARPGPAAPVDPVTDALRRIGQAPGPAPGPGTGTELPAELSAGQISRGVAPAVERARACGRRLGVTGTGALRLAVEGATGAVAQAAVTSGFAGPMARCVADAFRGARFARFRRDRQVVHYTVIVR